MNDRGNARQDDREQRESRYAFLSKVTRLLARSLDYETTLASVAGLALPYLGEWCVVDIVETDGSIRRLAIVHPDPEKQRLVRRLQESWPTERDDAIGGPVAVRTRETQVMAHVSDEMLANAARSEENLHVLRELGIGSLLVVPLIARGKILGAITFVATKRRQPYREKDVDLAEDVAALSALAIDNARLYREAEMARGRAERRAEEAERQHRDLERVMESQARLVRGFSHDVKNPLGAAAGYVQLLEAGVTDSLTPEQVVSMKRIGASIRSALGLIEDLVDYESGKLGTLDIEWGATNVTDVVTELAEEYDAQVAAAGLALEVEVSEGPPVIQSDRVRIRQILGNLISNAVKYTDEGRISVGVGRRSGRPAQRPGEWVVIGVKDTGRGIPKDKQHLLFQEFARLEPGSESGAGLGLAISQRIAEGLGGTVTLESEEGQGSTFTLWLPLRREKQAAPPEAA